MLRLDRGEVEEAVTDGINPLPMKRGFVYLPVVLDWAVIPDESAGPTDIRLLGAKAVMQIPDALAQAGEPPRRPRTAA